MLLLDNPITVPPTIQKTFGIVWIYNLTIRAHDPKGEGLLEVEIYPMSNDKELLTTDGPTSIRTEELYRAMSEVPELSAAFEAILSAVKPTQAWIDAQKEAAANAEKV